MITTAIIIVSNIFLRYTHHLYCSLQDLHIPGSGYLNDLILIHSKPVAQEMYLEHANFAPPWGSMCWISFSAWNILLPGIHISWFLASFTSNLRLFQNTLLTTLFEIHINCFPTLILFCLYHLTVNGILYLFIVILLSSPEHKLYENKVFVLCLYSLLYCQHLE